jgi:hypothetical protein
MGQRAIVYLPFEQPPKLVAWQYLRMLRWILVLVAAELAAVLIIWLISLAFKIPEHLPEYVFWCFFLIIAAMFFSHFGVSLACFSMPMR